MAGLTGRPTGAASSEVPLCLFLWEKPQFEINTDMVQNITTNAHDCKSVRLLYIAINPWGKGGGGGGGGGVKVGTK